MTLPEYDRISQSADLPGSLPSANLRGVEEDAATGEVAELYEYFRNHFGRPVVPGILKSFATHPPLLRHMMALSESLIFSDGHLKRHHKEMIATFVSSQNACPYCADSHGYFLRVHGGSAEALCAIQKGEIDSSALTEPEKALLNFAQKVNQSSHEISRADIETLTRPGWSEPQVSEAVHVAALFAAFNRVANAFGLASQGLLGLVENESSTNKASAVESHRSAH